MSEDIEKIDICEGTPNYYYRKNIGVIYNENIYQAFIYFRSSSNKNCMDSKTSLSFWSKESEAIGKENYKISSLSRRRILNYTPVSESPLLRCTVTKI